jgi:hypothetical protein
VFCANHILGVLALACGDVRAAKHYNGVSHQDSWSAGARELVCDFLDIVNVFRKWEGSYTRPDGRADRTWEGNRPRRRNGMQLRSVTAARASRLAGCPQQHRLAVEVQETPLPRRESSDVNNLVGPYAHAL